MELHVKPFAQLVVCKQVAKIDLLQVSVVLSQSNRIDAQLPGTVELQGSPSKSVGTKSHVLEPPLYSKACNDGPPVTLDQEQEKTNH